MKFDKSYYKEPELRMFEDLVYNGTLRYHTIYSGETAVGHIERIPLVQDSHYKTQFYNEKLRGAVLPKNFQTALKLFTEEGVEIPNPTNLFSLRPELGSIVFEVEPTTLPKYCECTIYDLYTAQDVFLKKDLDKALEINLDVIKASLHSFNSFTIKQDGLELNKLICNANNKYGDVILVKDNSVLSILTNPFLISPNANLRETYIEIDWGDLTLYRERLSDICNGGGVKWSLVSSKDIYETGKDKVYLYNAYRLEIRTSELNSFVGLVGKTPENLTIKVGDSSNFQKVSKEVGLDYLSRVSFEPSISYNITNYTSLRTDWVSGKSYFPNTEDKYTFPITIGLKNNAYSYYRFPYFNYGIKNKEDKEEVKQFTFTSLGRGEELSLNLEVEISKDTQALFVKTFDVLGEEIDSYSLEIDCTPAPSLEEYRVTTPGPNIEFPAKEDITAWNPIKRLEDFEPKYWDGEYTCESEENALAFEFDTDVHYSHIDLDIETDGKVYIRSKNNTGWLDTSKPVDVFMNPISNGRGCKASEGSYSFGRVNYIGPIWVRVLNAHSTKLNGFQIY